MPTRASLWHLLAALLLLSAALLLVVWHELGSVRLVEPVPSGSVGSAPGTTRPSQALQAAFDQLPRTAFMTAAPDGEAFAGLRYTSPVRVHGVEMEYSSTPPRVAQRVTRAKLQWSDDGETWHAGSEDTTTDNRRTEILASTSEAHEFWRFLVTSSGQNRLVVIGELSVVTAELRQWERTRSRSLLGAAVALLLGVAALAAGYRHERPSLATLGRRLLDATNRQPGAFRGLSVLILLYYNYLFLLKFDVAPVIVGDSGTYLNHSPKRTPGYPYFLDAFDALTGDWALFPALQLNLVLCGLILMAYAISRITRSHLLGMLFLGCALQLELLFGYSAQVVSEAPFAAFLSLHLAAMVLLLRKFSRPLALVAGALLALAVATKAVGMVLLAPAALSLLFLKPHRVAAALLILVPPLAYHVGISSYNYATSSVFSSSTLGGIALLGHVASGVEADPDSTYPELSARLEERLRPVLSQRPSSFDSILHYARHTKGEYGTQLWHRAVPEIRSYLKSQEHLKKARRDELETEVSKVAGVLAREAILRFPGRYAFHVTAHFYSMWMFSLHQVPLVRHLALETRKTPQFAQSPRQRRLVAGLIDRALEPANFEDRRLKPTLPVAGFGSLFRSLPAPIVSTLLLALSLVGCGLTCYWSGLSPPARAWCLCSLYANAHMGGTALAIFGSYRYVSVIQPVVLAMAILALLTLVQTLAARVRSRPLNRPAPAATTYPGPL